MKSIILLSKFIKIKKGSILYEFQFKRVFNGHRIQRIIAYSNNILRIKEKGEHLLNLSIDSLKGTKLLGHIKK
jgi:hypothetical protein